MLKDITDLDRLIRHKIKMLEELRADAEELTGLSMGERVQVSFSNNAMRKVDRLIDLTREVEKDLDRLVDMKIEALKVFRKLAPEDQEIMERRYLMGQTWEEIAKALGYSKRQLYRKRDKILKDVT